MSREQSRLKLIADWLWVFLIAADVNATVTYWDPTGATVSANPNGNWEDLAWSTTSALSPTTVNFVDSTAAGFSAGTSASGAFTVSLNTTQNVAGIFNGLTASIGTVTISGSGAINVSPGQQGFYTLAPGSTIIDVPLIGTAQVVIERNGQLYLNGTNTYTGGTQLGFSSSAFTGTVNINNNASFGTGSIIMFSSGGTIAVEGSTPLTIPNPVTAAAVTLNINANAASLTFGGNWNMAATPTIAASGQITISGVMTGAGGLNKFGTGTLKLTAANSYVGSTTISNGTLALGPTGTIGNSANLLIAPGANGSVFDVSANAAYTLGGATALVGMGSGTVINTAANIRGAAGGTVSFGARPVNLVFTPTVFTSDTLHPSLYISQGSLLMNNNVITVTNGSATPLGVGTYRVIQVGNGVTGTINGSPRSTVLVAGAGIAAGTAAALVVSNGNVNLIVKPPALFSGISITPSNLIGVGAVGVTLRSKLSAGAVYPARNETIILNINGSVRSASINDSTGDFSYSFGPSTVPYAATNIFTLIYAGNGTLAGATNTSLIPSHAYFAGDAAPGFLSGMNVFFTNAAGVSMFTWSSTNAGLPVTDWTLEGPMDEQPLNDGSGKSRYSINVNPAISLVYYICGPSIAWPYLTLTTVQSIITDSQGGYTFSNTTTTITPAGLLGLPAPPAIIQQPMSQTILFGQNATFNPTVVGSQPLSYQWYFNTNTPLPDAQTGTLTITNPTVSDVGNYMLVVTNAYGSTTSGVASLTLVPPPSMTSQSTSNGFQLSGLTVPGITYEVQSSTNLTDWTNIFTNHADSNGLLLFNDASYSTNPIRFYRLLFP
jgi:autotransporter-associated beta strand protein